MVMTHELITQRSGVQILLQLLDTICFKSWKFYYSASTVFTPPPKGSKSQVELNKQTALWAIPTDPWG